VVSPPGVDGRRFRFYGSRDVTFGFEPDTVPTDALASASWVHLGGVALTHPVGRTAMRELAAVADERGCTVSFDVNYRPDLVPEGERDAVVEAIRDILADTDVAFASDEDVAATGISSREGEGLARDVLEFGPHTAVVVTRLSGRGRSEHGRGAVGRDDRASRGFTVDAVDATGAGDAFTSGLINRLAAGRTTPVTRRTSPTRSRSPTRRPRSVRDHGGMTALPDREAVEAFVAERA